MTEERVAQENPASPSGWAQGNPANPDAHPGGELIAIEQQKRQDTAQWEDSQNRSPIDGVNPAQPPGFAVPEPTGGPIPGQGADAGPPTGPVMARVFIASDATSLVDGGVVLGFDNGSDPATGHIVAANDDKMWIEWGDGAHTIEDKGDYELTVRHEEEV